MSQPAESSPTPVVSQTAPTTQKQTWSIYTMMLLIAFAALTIGCILLWLELNEYGTYPWWNTTGAKPNVFVDPGLLPDGLRAWTA